MRLGRAKTTEGISGLELRAVFRSQAVAMARAVQAEIIGFQRGNFSEAERRILYKNGLRPSDTRLQYVAAMARTVALRAVYVNWFRRRKATVMQIKNRVAGWFRKPKAAAPPQHPIKFALRKLDDPSTGKSYWQNQCTGHWYCSEAEANTHNETMQASMDAIGLQRVQEAREVYARKSFPAPDYSSVGCPLQTKSGEIVLKTSFSRVYIINPKTVQTKSGSTPITITCKPGDAQWKPENFERLPDGNFLVTLHNCMRGGKCTAFVNELRMNRTVTCVGDDKRGTITFDNATGANDA
jgi:hypothetical protein